MRRGKLLKSNQRRRRTVNDEDVVIHVDLIDFRSGGEAFRMARGSLRA
jgi:hypothetical protein